MAAVGCSANPDERPYPRVQVGAPIPLATGEDRSVPCRPRALKRPRRCYNSVGMANDVKAMRAWITGRICETRQLAEEARAVAFDIEDRVLLDATVQLAADLENVRRQAGHSTGRVRRSSVAPAHARRQHRTVASRRSARQGSTSATSVPARRVDESATGSLPPTPLRAVAEYR